MKKYKIIYIVLILICIVMIITKGITIRTTITQVIDPIATNMGGVDGGYEYGIYIFNMCILTIIFIISIVITFNKKNTVKLKYFIFICYFILLLWIPIGIRYGIIGKDDYISLINIYLFFR